MNKTAGMSQLRLISASAGSGKTYSLTERILAEVESGVSPERIMAVTFTNKAAAELKERIRQKLVGQQGANAARLREQAASLTDAYIGTVNSICARLLREFAFEAGLSPAIDILPEGEGKRLFRLAVAHQIGTYHETAGPAACRLGRDGSGAGFAKKPDWKEDVQRIVNSARANGLNAAQVKSMAADSIQGLKELLGRSSSSVSDSHLIKLIDDAVVEIAACEDTTKKTREALSTLRRMRHALSEGYATWADWSALAGIAAGTRSGADECLEAVREYAAKVQHHPELHRDVETLIASVFDCASEALEGFGHYKRINGLMDFVDQESKILELLDSELVQQRLAERIDVLMVDEFQDTSPIQLALFSRLGRLVKRSIWVGDQKQAIYGFRGTDPKLMDEVIGRLGEEQLDVLEDSYRSRAGLVEFVNTTFEQAFDGLIPAERVRLSAKRADHDDQGKPLAVWHLCGSRKDLRFDALAEAVASLIREPDKRMIEDRETGQLRALKAGDIAILCRTNPNCREVADSLAAYGIPVSVGRGALLAQPECIVLMAGIRLLVDANDTLALAELVQYLPNHPSSASWLDELTSGLESAIELWKQDARIRQLLELREQLVDASPVELLSRVADLTGVRDSAFGRSDPQQVLANMESLEQLVVQYQDVCKANHAGASLAGLIYWLGLQDEPSLPEGRGEQTVQICTYHKSKGLEWPLVILLDLDSSAKFSPFGLHVEPASHFDPDNPLVGRWLRYWPEPVSVQAFRERVEQTDQFARARTLETEERQRLMYVGMTRARDYLVLAKPVSGRSVSLPWIDDLLPHESSTFIWPEEGDKSPIIKIADHAFACELQSWHAVEEPEALQSLSFEWHLPARVTDDHEQLPYAIVPSMHRVPEIDTFRVGTIERIGARTELPERVDMASLGESIHRFIAADRVDGSHADRARLAKRVLAGWGMQHVLSKQQLIEISDAFHAWVIRTWPGGRLFKEWPVRLRMGQQVAHGWMDALVETDDGYVIIDHKSFPGTEQEAQERVSDYAGQLHLYGEAVEKATGKRVVGMAIHFAMQGHVVHCCRE